MRHLVHLNAIFSALIMAFTFGGCSSLTRGRTKVCPYKRL